MSRKPTRTAPAATALPPPLLVDALPLDSPFRDPDFVDRVWAYMLQSWPQRLADIEPGEVEDVKQYIRQSERGERPYITPAGSAARERTAQRILSLFNGRNATEVARVVGCSRATVYRVLKQAGGLAEAPKAG